MAGQMILWFFLSCKRALKRPVLLLLLLLLPLGAWMFRQAEAEDSGRIPIALFLDGDEWNRKMADVLMAEDGAFEFYLCETKEELKNDVAAGRAECGFSFPADFRKRLEEGDYRRAVRVIAAPSTVAAKLASETVFAGLFEIYGRELLENYVKSGEAFSEAREQLSGSGELLWREVEPLYENALQDGSTFAFAYETVGGGSIGEGRMQAAFPVRGVGAVFVFVMGLAAAVAAAEDEERGFYSAVTRRQRWSFQLVSVCAMVVLACLSVLLSLAVSGEWKGAAAELRNLSLYGCMVTVYAFFLLRLVKKPLILSGLIPFFILGSLITCPVFADLSAFLPALSSAGKFFLPWYYLRL